MHLTEDFPISSRLIRKTFRDEQKMNPNSARNIWKLLARTRPEKLDPIPTVVFTASGQSLLMWPNFLHK